VQFKKHQFGLRRGSETQLRTLTQDLHITAPTNLSTFLTSVRDLESRLGVSVLMDETLTSQYKVPKEDIPQQVEVLIRTQTLSDDETRRAESNTREQNQCKKW